jgi:hypothetical protein
MHTPKQVNVAQYLNLHAPWQMPELISVMIANKCLALDRPFEKELNHQHLAKQCGQHVQIQQRHFV